MLVVVITKALLELSSGLKHRRTEEQQPFAQPDSSSVLPDDFFRIGSDYP